MKATTSGLTGVTAGVLTAFLAAPPGNPAW
jgi:hypothetical protein